MRIVPCTQGDGDWLAVRHGKITGSRMADVLSYLKKGGESQKRADYRAELVAERMTGLAEESRYISPEMRWGVENEPMARLAYEAEYGLLDLVGFALHPTLDYAGASPDGLSKRGGAEFKCPKTTTHLGYIEAGIVPGEYVPQMMWEIVCCERDWMDFVSFDPRVLDESLQMFVVRLHRNDEVIKVMEAEVTRFEQEIQAQIGRLYGRTDSSLESVTRGVLQSQLVQSLHYSADAG